MRMAQRLHGTANDTNLNTVHCDSYMNRLLKREKTTASAKSGPPVVKCPRDRSCSRVRQGNQLGALVGTTSPTGKGRSGALRQQNVGASKTNQSQNIVHKETFADNAAMVEVTVKTTNPRHRGRPDTAPERGESWAKLLKINKSSEVVSSFSNFDPLRTLHFLTKELQSKLINELPNNKNIIQMVIDMQYALNRVPPEIASTIHLHQGQENLPPKSHKKRHGSRSSSRSLENFEADKTVKIIKNCKSEKGTQTSSYLSKGETEQIQKQMEASTIQLENSCKHMELLCTRLQCEKNDLEQLLLTEKENVKYLRKELDSLQLERDEFTNSRLKMLEEEKEDLMTQVNKLTALVECQTGPASQELKSLIQELRLQKTGAEQECMSLRHKLTLANMERDKYSAILSIRDKQINEIRKEMNQLQDVVNQQLIELQTGIEIGFGSSPTSDSSLLDFSWPALCNKEMGDNSPNMDKTPSSINTSDTVHQLFLKNKLPSSSFRELPSGDSSGTSTVLHELQENNSNTPKKTGYYENLTPTKDLPVLDTNTKLKYKNENHGDAGILLNTKELFDEIKRKAYSIEMPRPSSKKNIPSDESINK